MYVRSYLLAADRPSDGLCPANALFPTQIAAAHLFLFIHRRPFAFCVVLISLSLHSLDAPAAFDFNADALHAALYFGERQALQMADILMRFAELGVLEMEIFWKKIRFLSFSVKIWFVRVQFYTYSNDSLVLATI
jgi:hypothetical protein